MDVMIQFISLMIFMVGIVLGEILAYRAFGKPKSSLVFFLDLVLIVLIISVVYSYMEFYGTGLVYYAVNFVIGVLTILIARAVEWMLHLTEKERVGKSQILGLIRTLARYGLDETEIKAVLKEMRMGAKVVDKYQGLIEKTVPKYMPRLARIEASLERLEKKMESRSR